MSKYIDRNQLIQRIKQEQTDGMYTEEILSVIDEIETADVAEVSSGKWIYNTDDFTPAERCSACGYNKPMIAGERTSQEPSNYCSNCGAKMDLGE